MSQKVAYVTGGMGGIGNALGGPDMRTAFVTSARAGLNDEEVGRQPEAGNVFSFEVDVPGIPAPLARL